MNLLVWYILIFRWRNISFPEGPNSKPPLNYAYLTAVVIELKYRVKIQSTQNNYIYCSSMYQNNSSAHLG